MSCYCSTCENRTLQADQNGIQHIVGNITNDLYALPMKKCLELAHDQINKLSPEKDWNSHNKLPPGWEKHEGQYIAIEKECFHYNLLVFTEDNEIIPKIY